jgi:short-subunit dehydrogenase
VLTHPFINIIPLRSIPFISFHSFPFSTRYGTVNVKGHFFIVKRAAQYMPKGGRIIIITSTAAYTGNENLGAYSVSKTALVGLIKMLSKALADRQITVNGIAPGIIRTRVCNVLYVACLLVVQSTM